MKKIALLAIVTVAAGCTQSAPKAQPPPPPGVVKTFTAAPTALTSPGDKTTLTWTTQDATTVTLEQLGVGPLTIPGANGSVDVTLSADATFLLTARGPGGTDSAAVGVKVGMAQGGVLFNAVPQAITSGQGATLVWNAPGAAAVTIADGAGAMVDLQGQTDHGSVRVTPARDATYTLTAGSVTKTVDISVAPVILAFTSAGSPNPGEMVNLSWKTGGGTQVVLTRDGVTAPLATVTDPAMVDQGGFSEAAPAELPADGVLHYTLTLTGSSGTVTKDLDVRINGSVSIDQFTVPAYARSPGQFTIQWKTSGATYLELQLDGATFYVSPDQATTDGFQLSLPSPAASETLTLIARNDRAEASKTATIEAVGTPTVVSFTSDKNSINTGGDAVVLSWNVTNARNVRINEVGGPVVTATSGHVDTGSVTVYPNRPSVTYHLVADNGAGDAIMPQELSVTVTTLATLTFDSVVPTGALTNVTGSTVPNAVSMSGLPNVVKNAPGEAFVDISQTGQALDHGFDTAAYVNTLPGLFYTRLFGHRVYLDQISIAVNGWFFFSTTSVDGPNDNTATFGTALEPLAIAPYWRDLTFDASTANAFAQLDDVAGTQRLIVQWQDMEVSGISTTRLTFQAQIYGDGKVVFAYQTLEGLPAGSATIGVVNGAETDAVVAPDQPVAGDTYTFFTTKALPAPIRVEPTPYVASVSVSGGGSIEVEGDARLLPGQFAITEVNPNPPALVTGGEWIEVTSFGTQLVNLQGWTLDFGGGNTHQIAQSVPLAPGTRVLLAQAADLGEPDAGIAANYVYPSTFAMPNTSGTVALALGGAPYSSVTWDTTMTGDAGIAVRADPGNTSIIYSGTNLQLACSGAGSPAYGDNGQYGTPGATQGHCFPYVLTAGMPNRFLPIGGSGTPIILGDAGTSATDDKVYAITLPTPVNVHGKQVTQLWVGTNGWITSTSTTSSVASNRSTPSTSAPNGSVAPFWDDLVGTLNPGSGMYWQQFDPDMTPATGDEFTIISWEQWKTYFGTTQINFQVKLGPQGAIEYDYGNMSDAGTQEDQGISATTWLEHPTGKAAMKINVNSATAPGIQPHTGFVYTYTP